MQKVADDNSDLASLYTAGKTFESRELKVVLLRTATSKKAIWIGKLFEFTVFY